MIPYHSKYHTVPVSVLVFFSFQKIKINKNKYCTRRRVRVLYSKSKREKEDLLCYLLLYLRNERSDVKSRRILFFHEFE